MHSRAAHHQEDDRRSHLYMVLLLWVLLGIVYLSLTGQWISLHSRDKALGEYTEYVLELAAAEHRPATDIRTLLLVRAEALSLPLDDAEIRVSGGGQTLRAVIAYDAEIRIPLLGRPLYRMEFQHDVQAPNSD